MGLLLVSQKSIRIISSSIFSSCWSILVFSHVHICMLICYWILQSFTTSCFHLLDMKKWIQMSPKMWHARTKAFDLSFHYWTKYIFPNKFHTSKFQCNDPSMIVESLTNGEETCGKQAKSKIIFISMRNWKKHKKTAVVQHYHHKHTTSITAI